ncbi:MAG: DNA polymerase/3'-5' exonuclease PolX [Acidimicrobiia bacterium]
MNTRDVIAMLWELHALTVLDEGSPQSFKARAYENAVQGIEAAGVDVTKLSKTELTALKGVGGSTADKILELVATGTVDKIERLRKEYPPEFVALSKIPGVGPKTLKTLRSELGIQNLEDLRDAIAEERLRTVSGLGKTSEEKIAKAIERLGLHGKDRRTPIAEAMPIATRLVADLEGVRGVVRAEYCGSLRRFSETIGDIDITVAATNGVAVMEAVRSHPLADEIVAAGDTKTSVLTREDLQIDVRVVSDDQFGAAVLYFTGSKAHNIALRQRAIDRGMLLNEYGLFDSETDALVASRTEGEIYAALDMAFVDPPLREGAGEVEAAGDGTLPDLVRREDIRGDLHYHTDRSGDGRSSLEDMVQAAVDAGYDYVAITDHGEDLAINGLSRDEMIAHRDAIRDLEQRRGDVRLLFGCELNIGPDGSLDYDSEFRSHFDWCVASIHSHFDLDPGDQTARLITAISDPSVNVIGHLTGRYIGRRPGIELDLDPVLEALSITGVGLEVNGALDRLDASPGVIRRAVGAGVRLVISTDSHHVSELGRMTFGVMNAQRGWAERTDVANTLPTNEFETWAHSRS